MAIDNRMSPKFILGIRLHGTCLHGWDDFISAGLDCLSVHTRLMQLPLTRGKLKKICDRRRASEVRDRDCWNTALLRNHWAEFCPTAIFKQHISGCLMKRLRRCVIGVCDRRGLIDVVYSIVYVDML